MFALCQTPLFQATSAQDYLQSLYTKYDYALQIYNFLLTQQRILQEIIASLRNWHL